MNAMRGTRYLSAWRQTASRTEARRRYSAENRNRAIEYTKAALDFDREVDVTRRIDDVDPLSRPNGSRRRK